MLVKCVLSQKAVLLIRTQVLALHLPWPTKLAIGKGNNITSAYKFQRMFTFSLGMLHDGTNNVCGGSQRIMAPAYGGQAENFLWSSCSAEYLQTFLMYDIRLIGL